MKQFLRIALFLLLAIPALLITKEFVRTPGQDAVGVPITGSAIQVAQGKYLALAGNCMGCHTVRGGAQYAGGRPIATPFGTIYSPNLTQDKTSGLGNWSADDFWRALHNGKSPDGSFLYPAFPYTSYTRMTRPDSDAMYAYFKTLAPVAQENLPNTLRFPYNQRPLLAAWRVLYFTPGTQEVDASQTAVWNRGAYLVEGLGHCSACHASRTTLGGSRGGLDGGLIPVLDWYAPSLTSSSEAGLGDWQPSHIVDLLQTGISPRGAVFGPMAEVVGSSLQHLSTPDLQAMAGYLKSLPQTSEAALPPVVLDERTQRLGSKLYEQHCVNCHRADGGGIPPHYPPLAGNRAITMESAINPIRIVLNGGFPPSTGGNPRPYGMPPFAAILSDAEVAAVVSYTRATWGNAQPPVTAFDVARNRAIPGD
ncbi:cytochrome c [Actimicrobium sp. CCI2.3]|uniref:cytochrome c n=1 Tax=Actimicrobium sp. CCI2.3 TaxID=3048616 RepID=UPI002AB43182|nr:cytochrome c [Actimicrobium sp. CCI2.3]MDY7573983.1 cytochrome c [Actimicrobium sp. CCI2.3]MEB0021909.1 cytochrome c [Actimicrobium sp. CCI2.3]